MSPTVPMQPQPTPAKPANVWMIVSIILAVALVGLLGFTFMKNSGAGNGSNLVPISSDKASQNLLSFINEVYGAQVGTATLKSVTEENGLYKVTVNITANGQPVDQVVYVTRDGALFIPQVVNVADVTKQYRDFKAQQQNQPAANTNTAPTNANANTNTAPTNTNSNTNAGATQ